MSAIDGIYLPKNNYLAYKTRHEVQHLLTTTTFFNVSTSEAFVMTTYLSKRVSLLRRIHAPALLQLTSSVLRARAFRRLERSKHALLERWEPAIECGQS